MYAPNSLAARDVAYALHPYTDLSAHQEKGPLIITRGEGIYVWDDDDNKYIEGMAGLWCTALGFSESRLVDAATRQLKELPYTHLFSHRSATPVIELAEALIKIAPEGMSKAFFTCSGSEAVDTAIKMVWYYHNGMGQPEKKKLIARKRGYHGVTIAAGSLTGLPYAHDGFDMPLDRFRHADTPCFYRHGEAGESEEAFATRLAANLEQMILDEGPETVGAFIAEPVMGAGGVIVPPMTYFEKVQEVLDRYDVLMIADEVICGFGRTGNMWGSQTFNIRPDIVTCAKQLSSAYMPIGATLINDKVFQVLAEQSKQLGLFGTGFTYGGHPVSAAVALETLKIYEERDIVSTVRNVAPRFQKRLKALGSHPLVGQARGVGLIGALELVANKETRQLFEPDVKPAVRVVARALEQELILRATPGDSVAVCPPLIISESEIDHLFDRLTTALDQTAEELKV